jgi:hypothetical protein
LLETYKGKQLFEGPSDGTYYVNSSRNRSYLSIDTPTKFAVPTAIQQSLSGNTNYTENSNIYISFNVAQVSKSHCNGFAPFQCDLVKIRLIFKINLLKRHHFNLKFKRFWIIFDSFEKFKILRK